MDTRIRLSAKVKLVGRDEAGHHAVQRAGDADQEVAEHEGDDLPARDVEAEAGRRGLVEAHRVDVEPDPGALEPAHQHERGHQTAAGEHHVVDVERQLEPPSSMFSLNHQPSIAMPFTCRPCGPPSTSLTSRKVLNSSAKAMVITAA